MKAAKLKRWQLFYNTNNYLCLVYNITGNSAHIINYNGTIYKAKRDSNHEYSDEVPKESVEEFFMNFPKDRIDYHEKREEFNYIKNLYYTDNRQSKMLLLC